MFNTDQCVVFDVGVRLENDFLIRMRHYHQKGKRISVLRAYAHTSFVADNVMRLTREQLDISSPDHVYPADFFIDLIFTDARNQSNVFMTAHAPESTAVNTHLIIDVEDEERRLMAKGNTECKDDFWIGLSQSLSSDQTTKSLAPSKK